jgi:uroporphyrinogen-III synthase
VAAVGDATALALGERGWPVALVNAGAGAADLGRTLAAAEDPSGAAVLFLAGSRARDTLVRELVARGARVTRVEAYRTLLAGPDPARVRDDLARGVDAVTFPTTARELITRGVRRVVLADRAGFAGVLAAAVRVLAGVPAAGRSPASPSPAP